MRDKNTLYSRYPVSKLDFEKCVSHALGHYEGSIFGGVGGVRKFFDNSV